MLSPADQELVSRDRALPALGTALDGEKVAAALRSALKRDDIHAARVNYIRYKPATSCLSAATAVIGGQSHRLHVTAFREGESAKIDKAIALAVASPFGSGAVRLGAHCLATFFPNDATVRSLARLNDHAAWRELLSRVFENDSAMLDAQWSVLAYKPDRRAALRLDVDGKPTAVLKLYGNDHFEVVRRRAKLFNSTDALRVPRRLGKSGGLSALGLEWMSGRELTSIFQMKPDAVAESIALTVAALTDLHRQTSVALHPVRDHLHGALRAQVGAVVGLCPHLAQQASALADELDGHLSHRPIGAAAIHGDFYTKQVLIDSDCAVILDLDDAAIGEPEQDLGNFLGHLDWYLHSGRVPQTAVAGIDDALIAGYARCAGSCDRLAVMLYRAIGVFRLATRPFRDRSVDWPSGVAGMLELVRRHLRGVDDSSRIESSVDSRGFSDGSAGASPAALGSEIPTLAAALDIARASPLLEPIARARVVFAALVRHKPARRAMVDYVLADDTGERRVLGKIRAKGLDQRAFDNQKALFDAGFNAAESDVAVPRPIAAVPALSMWLQERVNGDSFLAALEHTAPPALAQRVARAIAKLHEAEVRPARAHTAADELKILLDRLELSRLAISNSPKIDRVATACRELAAGLASTPLAPIHRDFYHDQMLFSPSVDYLLDVDLLSAGDGALDVGNFVAHLIELSLRRPNLAPQLSAVADELPRVYTAIRPSVSQQRIDAYTTLSLARHIHISTLFEDRAKFTDQILSIVEQRLGV